MSWRLCFVSCAVATIPVASADFLWLAHLKLPAGVVVRKTQRGGDPGWGVDLSIGQGEVNASVVDDDGDAFFEISRGAAFCKIDVGSDGLGPGLQVSVFEQKNLRCDIHGEGRSTKVYTLTITAQSVLDESADCNEKSDTEAPCHPAWRPHQLKQTSEDPFLWLAMLKLPAGVAVHKTQRGGDPGWGVDLSIGEAEVNASVVDDDGDAFFEISRGAAFCKIDVGSDGLGPGLQVSVFEQKNLRCDIHGEGGATKVYALTITAQSVLDESADCSEKSDTEAPCKPPWRPQQLKQSETSEDPFLWLAMLKLPAGVAVRKTQRGGDHGWGVDLSIGQSEVNASVLDDDGDAFFEISRGAATCKIDVGSDGRGPGLQVSVFEQKNLRCDIHGQEGPAKVYSLTVTAQTALDGSADCSEKTDTDAPCHPAWRPPEMWSSTAVIV